MAHAIITISRNGETLVNDRVQLGEDHDPDYCASLEDGESELTVELNEVVT